MTEHRPELWCVLKITPKDQKPIYKVFGTWHGGYASSNSWRLNSGITKVTKVGLEYLFYGSSGSIYNCYDVSYGTNMYGKSILEQLIDKVESNGGTIEILPEETNWSEIDYENP